MEINFQAFLVLFFGGGIGAVCRLLISAWVQERVSTEFPLGTLVVNILGCLAIGWIWAWLSGKNDHLLYLFFVTGLIGGFTTFSTFGLDSLIMMKQNKTAYLLSYILLSNILGILAVFGGSRLQQLIAKMI